MFHTPLESSMYLLQDAPAQTMGYMIAGYVVIFGVMLIYMVSLFIRNRNMDQDLQVLAEIEENTEQQ
jgi:hypothetical protein